MEGLLHYVWHHRAFPPEELHSTDGRVIEVIDVGKHNLDQGPDFFNAKIKIDGTLWAGNVEIHNQASDWYAHRHNDDERYDNTILHVIGKEDAQIVTHNGQRPPQLVLKVPIEIERRYDELQRTEDYPRCHRLVPSIAPMKVHAWTDALLVERLMERSKQVLDRVARLGGDWERATFVTLARNFGFGLNGDAFEIWAGRIPLMAAAKHRNNIEQVAAIFLGIAGFLDTDKAYLKKTGIEENVLQREWLFLKNKFGPMEPMAEGQWKHMRIRPQNFPEVGIMHLAQLYCSGKCSLHSLLEQTEADSLHKTLHDCGITASASRLLTINTVVPVLYAYGIMHNNDALRERAVMFLESLGAEENRIMRQWRDCGLKVENAADSQALLWLKQNYCDRRRCLDCRFGMEFLSVPEKVITNNE